MSDQVQKLFKSPINTNISKHLYSFSKSERFNKPKESTCKRSFYNSRLQLETRATSFGFGNKISLVGKQIAPPPGSYDPKIDFMNNMKSKKGYSFSHNKRVVFEDPQHEEIPGPGKYDKLFSNTSGFASYSIRSKYEDPQQRTKNKTGPGQYECLSVMNNTGIYANSKYRGAGCGKIGRAARFDDERTLPPGPGKYNDKLQMNKTGTYFNSKLNSSYVSKFEGIVRPQISQKQNTPGPGTYYVFSSFNSAKHNF